MKDSILKRAREGAAIIVSSHLMHLVEQICSHILILKQGRKVIDGSMAAIRHRFSQESAGNDLEEVFLRATAEPPPAPPVVTPAPPT